jgi:uncharacterized protein
MVTFLRALLALVLYLVPLASWAYPQITRPVTDLADVLSDEQEADIARKLTSHRALTQVQIAVLTVASTDGVAIERYSLDTARQWAGGNAVENNGVLYVLAVRDRRHHIEVGTGLTALLPNDRRRMMLDAARPPLRASDYTGAVRVVVDHLVGATGGAVVNGRARTPSTVAGEAPPIPSQPAPSYAVPATQPSNEGSVVLLGLVLLLFAGFVAVIFFMIFRGVRHSRGGSSFTHGGHGLTYGAHDHSASWNHNDHDTSSSASFFSSSSSDASSSNTDYSSSSSSSSSDYSSSSSSSSSDYSGGGGSFGGGGSSSDW